MLTRYLTPLVLKILAAGLLLAVVMFGISQCQNARNAKQQARLSDAQAGAASDNAVDAIGTVGGVQDRDRAGDDLTRTNEQEIRAAEGADASVGAVGNAGMAALCRRVAYKDDPRCVG